MKTWIVQWRGQEAIVIGYPDRDSAVCAAFREAWDSGVDADECYVEEVTTPTIVYRDVEA